MADGYKVGNLEIAFKAVDETSASFKELAKNLRAINSLVTKLGNADLSPFIANIKKVSSVLNPMLKNISGASEGIIALNQSIQKVGVSKLTRVSQEFINISREIDNTVNSGRKLTEGVNNAKKALVATTQQVNNLDETYKKYLRSAQTPTKLQLLDQISQAEKELDIATRKLEQFQGIYERAAKYGSGEGLRASLVKVGVEVDKAKEKVEQLKKAFGSPFNEAQASVAQLTSQLSNLHYVTGNIDQNIVQSIQQLRTQIDTTTEATKRALMTDQEKVIYDYKVAQAERQKQIEFYRAALATGQAGKNTAKYRKELAKLEKEQGQSEKATKKGTNAFKKFANSLKRIALYRAVRAILNSITKSFKETVQAYAEVDDGVNETMSSIVNSFNIIKLSLGTVLMPVLQMVAPILQSISVGFANMANTINQAMSATGKYTKISTEALADYREELQNAGTLLDFDKFRSLNTQTKLSDYLMTEEEVDETDENVQRVRKILASLQTIISKVFDILTTIGKPTIDAIMAVLPTLTTLIEAVVTTISNLVHWLDETGLLEPIIYGIIAALTILGGYKLISGISKLTSAFGGLGVAITAVTLAVAIISNWNEFSQGAKAAIIVISTLIAVFTGLAIAILAANGALTFGAGVALAVTAIAAGAVAISGMIREAKAFKDGGLPDKGTMFIAGEAGAEVVYNNSNGQSGVANVSQLKAAFYQALVEWSSTQKGSEQPIVVNLDGSQIYNNIQRNSKRRANNSGLHL